MPHYYMNIEQHGEIIVDLEGEAFDNLDAARQEAIAAAREIMSDRVAKGKPANDSAINIVDEERRPVLRVPFKDAISNE